MTITRSSALCSTVLYGSISVTCTREEMRDSFAYRDFTLLHADLPGSTSLLNISPVIKTSAELLADLFLKVDAFMGLMRQTLR
jgi:hypothetical protein